MCRSIVQVNSFVRKKIKRMPVCTNCCETEGRSDYSSSKVHPYEDVADVCKTLESDVSFFVVFLLSCMLRNISL